MNLVKFLVVEAFLIYGILAIVMPIISITTYNIINVEYLSILEMSISIISIIYSILLEKANTQTLRKILIFGNYINIISNIILIIPIINNDILIYWVLGNLQFVVITKLLTTSDIKINNVYFSPEDFVYQANINLYLFPITTMIGASINIMFKLDFQVACILLAIVETVVSIIELYVIKKFYI